MSCTDVFNNTEVTVFVIEETTCNKGCTNLYRYSGTFVVSDETGTMIRRSGKLVFFPADKLVRIEAP